jgi:hypothetical protein
VIQRFVFIKLEDPHVETRADLADRLRAEFAEAGAEAVVGTPADDSAARWDLSIVIVAASVEAWHGLARTRAMLDIFADLAERSHVTKAWTFEVGSERIE